uniref:Cytochrome P450 n=1 Tax=Oryza meridionalis TaxID=40149 RepID=A0A0E0D4W8_9ORYZ
MAGFSPIEIFSHINDICPLTGALPNSGEAFSPLEISDPILIALPFLGNLHQLSRTLPYSSLRALAASRPVVMLRLGRVNTVLVSTADAAREVMHDQDSSFASRPRLTVPRRLLYGCTDIAFAPLGVYWRAARKASVLHLLGPARVRGYRAVREEEVGELLRLVEVAASGGIARLSELLSALAKDVAGRIVLGIRGGGLTLSVLGGLHLCLDLKRMEPYVPRVS